MEQLLLIAWRQAESDACRAERAAANAGSRASLLQAQARRLREEADRQFAELIAPAQGAEPSAPAPLGPPGRPAPRLRGLPPNAG